MRSCVSSLSLRMHAISALRCSVLSNSRCRSHARFNCTQKSQQTFILRYAYVPNILERRGEFRKEHLDAAKKALDEGRLVVGGAYSVLGGASNLDPPKMGAHIVFRGDDESDALAWADNFTAVFI